MARTAPREVELCAGNISVESISKNHTAETLK
jgi:hypothetical protein